VDGISAKDAIVAIRGVSRKLDPGYSSVGITSVFRWRI
jgi:hypothetical protein